MPSWTCLDLETVVPADVEQWVEHPTPADAPSNYSKPETIAKWCAETLQKRIERAAVDIDLASLLCAGVQTDTSTAPHIIHAWTRLGEVTPETERAAVSIALNYLATDLVIGFHIASFDLPVLLRRAQLLEVPDAPRMETRYRETSLVWPLTGHRTRVADLADELTWNGRIQGKGLAFYAKRFGCPIEDETDGSQIGAMCAAGHFDGIEAHCSADVARTVWLAKKLGVIERVPAGVVA